MKSDKPRRRTADNSSYKKLTLTNYVSNRHNDQQDFKD